jgi:hypothetical protein
VFIDEAESAYTANYGRFRKGTPAKVIVPTARGNYNYRFGAVWQGHKYLIEEITRCVNIQKKRGEPCNSNSVFDVWNKVRMSEDSFSTLL